MIGRLERGRAFVATDCDERCSPGGACAPASTGVSCFANRTLRFGFLTFIFHRRAVAGKH